MIKVDSKVRIKTVNEIGGLFPDTEFYNWILENGGKVYIVREVRGKMIKLQGFDFCMYMEDVEKIG
jgi:hypothetical protein